MFTSPGRRKLRWFLGTSFFCGIVFQSAVALANEAPAAGDKKEAPKEAVPLPGWVDLEGKIAELATKIKLKEATIEKMLHEKKELPNDSPHVKPLIQEIVREHKELQKLIQDYEKKRSNLRYRYPERGLKTERIYKKIETKSLDEVEAAVGIDGKLNRNLHRMRSQYGTTPVDPSGAGHATPTSAPKSEEKSIENEGSVILRK